MKRRNLQVDVKTVLTAIEAETAGVIPVWVVWWEDPDRSWESLCLSTAEFDREYEIRRANHRIQHWGKLGKHDQQSLLAWLEGHVRAATPDCVDNFVNPVKEILRKVSAGESGPIVVRTW